MTKFTSRLALSLLAAGLMAAAPLTATAQQIECGGQYVVKRGDSLARISRLAYGNVAFHRLLFRLNRGVIGADPAGMDIGIALDVPCLDSSGQVIESVKLPAPDAGTETAADPAPEIVTDPDRPMRIAVASGWPPLADQGQAQGGMLTEIVSRAAEGMNLPQGIQVYYLNDWGGLIDPMVAEGRYDMALGWFRPDCARAAPGSESGQLCERLAWSEPLYQQVMGVYTLTGAPPPLSSTDLYGATLCRPDGYPLYVLAESGLVEPNVTLAQPDTARECFEGLLNGAYQAVVMAQDVAEGVIEALAARDTIIRQPTLDTVETLHAVAASNNRAATERLAALDEQIRDLKANGEWFAIVRRHMAEFRLN